MASKLPSTEVGAQMISKPASNIGLPSPTSRVALAAFVALSWSRHTCSLGMRDTLPVLSRGASNPSISRAIVLVLRYLKWIILHCSEEALGGDTTASPCIVCAHRVWWCVHVRARAAVGKFVYVCYNELAYLQAWIPSKALTQGSPSISLTMAKRLLVSPKTTKAVLPETTLEIHFCASTARILSIDSDSSNSCKSERTVTVSLKIFLSLFACTRKV